MVFKGKDGDQVWLALEIDGVKLQVSNADFFEDLVMEPNALAARKSDSIYTFRKLEGLGLVEKEGPKSAERWRSTEKLRNMLPILNAALMGNLVSAELADENEVSL